MNNTKVLESIIKVANQSIKRNGFDKIFEKVLLLKKLNNNNFNDGFLFYLRLYRLKTLLMIHKV